MGIKHFLAFLLLVKTSSTLLQSPIELSQNSYFDNQCVCHSGSEEDIKSAINKTNNDIEKMRIEEMIPGLVAGLSIKGKNIWTQAFGKTDIENNVTTHKDSVWRMASISKSLTTALIGKLIEKGLIDLENSIHKYLSPNIFPVKQWNGKNVTITVRQVLSHTAGLRVSKFPDDVERIYDFKNVTQTISQFKNEPLIHEPGNGFNYSNYGFQIIGAIIESVMNESYENAINKFFKELGMSSTFAERHEMIIPHRAHYYMKNNSPFLENYKNVTKVEILNAMIIDDLISLEAQWPCGGLVSTVPDLLKFGNYMLNSYKGVVDVKSGYLKSSTVAKLWTPNSLLLYPELLNTSYYAQGWFVSNLTSPIVCSGNCKSAAVKQMIWHTGGITGVSTILVILPEQDSVIAVLTNLGYNTRNFDMVFQIVRNFAQN